MSSERECEANKLTIEGEREKKLIRVNCAVCCNSTESVVIFVFRRRRRQRRLLPLQQ